MYRITAVVAMAAAASAAAVSTADNCSTRSVCADYINECGMMYGGCFPDCKPWPTFSPPPCPSTTSSVASVTPTPSGRACAKPSSSSTRPTAAAAASSSSSLPVAPITTLVPYATAPATTTSDTSKPCGGESSCATSYRTCPATTITFGGCWPACSPRPFYTPPPCPVSTSSA